MSARQSSPKHKPPVRGTCAVCGANIAVNKSTRRLRVHKTKQRGWLELCAGSGLPPKGVS